MGMKMALGRSFSKEYGEDNTRIIFNEAAIKAMGIKNPVGKNVKLFGYSMQIVGVVKDFHFESLHEPVKPSYMFLSGQNNTWNKIMIRISSQNQKQTIQAIQNYYEAFNPDFLSTSISWMRHTKNNT
jgi:hypothetical protein